MTVTKPRIALISNIGFSDGWHPLGIALIKNNLQKLYSVNITAHFWSSEFSWYINRYHPHLEEINGYIGEEGGAFHEHFFSAKLFRHSKADQLVRQRVMDAIKGRDIYRRRFKITSKKGNISDDDKYYADCVIQYCKLANKFVSKRISKLLEQDLDAICFSCVEQQLLCSIYTASTLRQCGYKGKIIFGGPTFRSWNKVIYELFFPFVDHILVGDGIQKLPPVLNLQRKSSSPQEKTYQYHFGDFSDLPPHVAKSTLFRYPLRLGHNCSWGQCLFCSITDRLPMNNSGKEVALRLLRFSRKHKIVRFGLVDPDANGIFKNFDQFCEVLRESKTQLDLSAMLNTTNLNLEICTKMKKAGFTNVLIGVESLSNEVLKLMRKRAKVINNIAAIKWLIECDIPMVHFNLILDFPGTTRTMINETLHNLFLIRHLFKANLHGQVIEFSLERESKAFQMRETLRLTDLKNYKFNETCFPKLLRPVIKFHMMRYKWNRVSGKWKNIKKFLQKDHNALLQINLNSNVWTIQDTRDKRKNIVLSPNQGKILHAVSKNIRTINDLTRTETIKVQRIKEILLELEDMGLIIRDKNRFFGLATRQPPMPFGG